MRSSSPPHPTFPHALLTSRCRPSKAGGLEILRVWRLVFMEDCGPLGSEQAESVPGDPTKDLLPHGFVTTNNM